MKRPMLALAAGAAALVALFVPTSAGQDLIVKTDGSTLPKPGGREISVVKESCTEIEYKMEGLTNILRMPARDVDEIRYKRMPEAYESGLQSYDDQAWEQAIGDFHAAIERGKGYHWVESNALYRIALCYMRMGQYKEAVNTYRTLIKNVPNSRFLPQAYLGIIQCTFFSQGAAAEQAITEAVDDFRRAIKKNRLDEAWDFDIRYEELRLKDAKGDNIDAEAEKLAREAAGTNRLVANKARVLIGLNLLKRDPGKAREYFENVARSAGERDFGIKAAAYCGIGESMFKSVGEDDTKAFVKARDYLLRALVLSDKYADRVEREVAVKAMFYAGRCFVLLRKEKDGAHNLRYARDLFREIQRDYPGSVWATMANDEMKKL